jgi:hypothetical protein
MYFETGQTVLEGDKKHGTTIKTYLKIFFGRKVTNG